MLKLNLSLENARNCEKNNYFHERMCKNYSVQQEMDPQFGI